MRTRRRGRRSTSQRILILTNCVVALLCFALAGGFAVLRQKASELPVVNIDAAVRQRTSDDAPRNFLLVGTDSSAGYDSDDPITDGRSRGEHLADVIMILHVEPRTKQASLLSIPRDSWVPIAPTWSKAKINSTFATTDGTTRLISTIKHNFGISIDHTVIVDFAGFRQVIDVLGGLPTYNTKPIKDHESGMWLPATGCIVIEPRQALAYARSRHFQYQDLDQYNSKAKWRTDGTGDLGRISRQQDFLRQAAQTAINEGIRNPSTAFGLINAAIGSVTLDDQLNVEQMVDLIQTFRDFSVDSLQAEQIPTSTGGSTKLSYQNVIWDQAEGLLDIYRGIRAPGEVQPGDVIVGLPADAAGSTELSSALDAAGFDAGTEDSSVQAPSKKTADRPTIIRFGLRGNEAAQVLAAHLDGAYEFEFSTELPGRRLELIPGTAVPTLHPEPLPVDQVTPPTIPQPRSGRGTTTTTSTTTTTAPRGSTTTVPGGVTTTSVASAPTTSTLQGDVTTTTAIGVVTLDAKAAAECPG